MIKSKTDNFKNNILGILPSVLAKKLYAINHKEVIFEEQLVDGEIIKISVPENMLAGYKRGHETGVKEKMISKYSGSKGVVYDVGACFGYYSQVLHCVSESKIYGFEPFIGHSMFFERTAELSKNPKEWTLVPKFVGEKTEGKTVSLDDFSATNESPTLIKIDADGFELEVLKGCKKIIKNGKTNFLIEFHMGNFNDQPKELFQYISDTFGFQKYEFEYLKDIHSNNIAWESNISKLEGQQELLKGDVYVHVVLK